MPKIRIEPEPTDTKIRAAVAGAAESAHWTNVCLGCRPSAPGHVLVTFTYGEQDYRAIVVGPQDAPAGD